MSELPEELIASLPLPVCRVAPLSRSGEAPAFRIDLTEGRIVKARVFRSERAAARVERFLRGPAAADLPRPVSRTGRVLIVEFVEGRVLDTLRGRRAPTAEAKLVEGAGAVLARLHAGERTSAAAALPSVYPERIARVARTLERARLIEPERARLLARLRAPRRCRIELTHGDICPENLVLDRGGRLRVVDEERLAPRPIAFDLARTVCRWPLPPRLEARLLAGYAAEGGDVSDFSTQRAFWIAAALATSAEYRLRRDEAAPRAVAALRTLARTLERSGEATVLSARPIRRRARGLSRRGR